MNTASEVEFLARQYSSLDFTTHSAALDRLLEAGEEVRRAVYEAARPLAEEQLRQAVASGDPEQVIDAFDPLRMVVKDLKDYAAALTLAKEEFYWRKKFHCLSPFSYSAVGWALKDHGDLTAARRYMEEAVALARTRGFEPYVAMYLFGLGAVCGAQGKLGAARRYFGECIVLEQAWLRRSPTHDISFMLCHIYLEYATALLNRGRSVPAVQLLAAAHQLALTRKDPPQASLKANPQYQEALERANSLMEAEPFAQTWKSGETLSQERIQITFFPWNPQAGSKA